jgi:prevent-host-death family protein
MKNINASEFKAKCLALIEEVAETGETITILKRGKAVAQLVPAVPAADGFPQSTLKGTVRIVGDIMEPPFPPEAWEAEAGDEE